jgi:chemotaxis protein MotB
MAYGRARRSTNYGEFWPGYVDVLSTLLLVVTFLMSVFMVSQFYVSQEASGKDTALQKLTRQIAEITNLLSLEKGKGKSLEDELANLQASLATLRSDNERLSGVAGSLGDKEARIAALSTELAE